MEVYIHTAELITTHGLANSHRTFTPTQQLWSCCIDKMSLFCNVFKILQPGVIVVLQEKIQNADLTWRMWTLFPVSQTSVTSSTSRYILSFTTESVSVKTSKWRLVMSGSRVRNGRRVQVPDWLRRVLSETPRDRFFYLSCSSCQSQ